MFSESLAYLTPEYLNLPVIPQMKLIAYKFTIWKLLFF